VSKPETTAPAGSAGGASRHADRTLHYAAVCVAVFCWGLGPLFVRAIDASAVTIVFWRLWIAAPVTWTLAYFMRRPLTVDVVRHSVIGGLTFAGTVVFSFASFQQTSLANAALIGSMTPIPVLLVAGRMFGERVTRVSLAFAGVSIAGVAAVVLGAGADSGASLKGDLLAVVGLLLFTAYFLEIKRQRMQGLPVEPLLAGVMLVAALAVTPVALLTSNDLGTLDHWDWFWIAALVLVPGTAGHGLMAWAHAHVDVTISSLLTLANPVISTIGAWLVYDQSLTSVQILGAGLVLGGLVGVVAGAPRPSAEVPVETT
jgi:drug/metabolite transporter (DMT)-like permease